MADESDGAKVTPVTMEPVTARVSASAFLGTGPGGIEPSKTIQTPAGQPNVVLVVVKPLTLIGVRVLRTYLQTLLGLVTAGIVAPNALPAKDFIHLLALCASLSVASAAISLIQNIIELLAQFDQSHPTLTG